MNVGVILDNNTKIDVFKIHVNISILLVVFDVVNCNFVYVQKEDDWEIEKNDNIDYNFVLEVLLNENFVDESEIIKENDIS